MQYFDNASYLSVLALERVLEVLIFLFNLVEWKLILFSFGQQFPD